jgi:hypothetical protein
MLIKEIDLQNYLFNTDAYELPPERRLEIMSSLRREMIEFSAGGISIDGPAGTGERAPAGGAGAVPEIPRRALRRAGAQAGPG